MLKKTFATALPLLFFLSLLFPLVSTQVFAQATGEPRTGGTVGEPNAQAPLNKTEYKLDNPFTFNSVSELVEAVLKIIIKVGWILAFFFLIYSGFLFVTAAGNEEQIKKAKATFMWTLIGSAIVLGAQALAILIENTVKEVVGR